MLRWKSCERHIKDDKLRVYQPSGKRSTCSPSATPHRLLNAKWPTGSGNMFIPRFLDQIQCQYQDTNSKRYTMTKTPPAKNISRHHQQQISQYHDTTSNQQQIYQETTSNRYINIKTPPATDISIPKHHQQLICHDTPSHRYMYQCQGTTRNENVKTPPAIDIPIPSTMAPQITHLPRHHQQHRYQYQDPTSSRYTNMKTPSAIDIMSSIVLCPPLYHPRLETLFQ